MSEDNIILSSVAEDSILGTIKKMLGLDLEYNAFDQDIIVFLNSGFMKLQQIGVGPVSGFSIDGVGQRWEEFLPTGVMIEGAKTYLYLGVKMMFDPPGNSYVMEAMKQEKEELEWRLREQAEFYPGDGSKKGYFEQLAAAEEADNDTDSEAAETEGG